MAQAQSVTSIDQSPEDERKSRMIRYTIAMVVRVICLIVGMFVSGWLMWICFAGAIFLPYFAVIIANAQGGGKKGQQATSVLIESKTIEASDFKIVDAAQGPQASKTFEG
jgi:predicted tellurium resistance membrane protein TerC